MASTCIMRLSSHALDDREDVAFSILEPCRLRSAGGNDAARAPFARHVVVLELDATRLQLGHFTLDVIDLPERLARLRRAGVRCRVEEACRPVAEFVRDAARDLVLRSEAELVFVEAARAGYILGGDVRVEGKSLQHVSLHGFDAAYAKSCPHRRPCGPQPRRAASMAAMSIFLICIIASKARFAARRSASAIASVRARGVICQDRPHLSLHQPHALSWPPFPTIAFHKRSVSAWSSVATWNENASLCLNAGPPFRPRQGMPI